MEHGFGILDGPPGTGYFESLLNDLPVPALNLSRPDRVKELSAKWEAWAQRAQVKPYPDAAEGKKANKAKKKEGKTKSPTSSPGADR